MDLTVEQVCAIVGDLYLKNVALERALAEVAPVDDVPSDD